MTRFFLKYPLRVGGFLLPKGFEVRMSNLENARTLIGDVRNNPNSEYTSICIDELDIPVFIILTKQLRIEKFFQPTPVYIYAKGN